MTEKTYTAADFAVAEFAKHPDGSLAVRMHPDYPMPWRVVAGSQPIWFAGDYDMAADGWVPVKSSPAKPTITAGEVGRRSHLVRGDNVETPSLVDFLEALGIEVVPDPVPSNAERLAALMYEADEKDHSSVPGGWEHVAEFLDRAGVTAPGRSMSPRTAVTSL